MEHVRRGPWLAHDTIALRLRGKDPMRREEEIEEYPQDNTGIDPPQDFPHGHPEAIDVGETPRPGESQDNERASQDEAPQTERLTAPHRRP